MIRQEDVNVKLLFHRLGDLRRSLLMSTVVS